MKYEVLPKISLCMIVRDNERTIGAALQSIKPWVDEMIIVDTGSTDQTKQICEELGARLFDYPWHDDFAAARNESIRHATGDWIFWMDSDDIIPKEQGRLLRKLVDSALEPDCMAYVVQVRCVSGNSRQSTVVDHVKLVRNVRGIRFENRIHEQILPSIRQLNGQVEFSNVFVVHVGSVQTERTRAQKLERDLRILHLELAEKPNHPFVHFNLGMTLDDAGRFSAAEAHLRTCIQNSGPGESHLRKAWAILVNSLRCQDRLTEALAACQQALAHFDGDKELLFRRGSLFQALGSFSEAIQDYERVLYESVDRVFSSVDESIVGYKAHFNLACSMHSVGDTAGAMRHWEACIKANPYFANAWLCMGKQLALAKEASSLSEFLARIPETPDLAPVRVILESAVQIGHGNTAEAVKLLKFGWQETRDFACLDELAHLLTSEAHYDAALEVLTEMSRIQTESAATLHNLGHVCYKLGRNDEAAHHLRRSLALRPNAPQTKELLATVEASQTCAS